MHVNIKRLLSFLVVLAMVLSMTPVTGIPAIEAKAEEASETVKTTVADNLVFLEGTQTAYCPVCKADAQWEVYTGQHADTVQNIAGTTPRFHYYLTEDLEYTTNALQTYENICFHLNGHDVKPAAASTTSARPFSCTQNFDLMGTGTVYGGKVVTANAGTIISINGGKASGCFEMHSGTLVNSEGVSHPLLTIGANGGRAYIYGGTVDGGTGEAIYTYGTNTTNTNPNRGYANVKIAGGTVNGDLTLGYKTASAMYDAGSSLNLLGGTVNGTVNLIRSTPATLGGNATATNLSVGAGSVLTVKEGWSGSATVDFAASLAASSVVEGAFTGTLTRPNGDTLVSSNGVLKVNATFDPAAETNYCAACDAYVAWTALPATVPTLGTDGAHPHYYVPEDMTATGAKNAFLYAEDSNGSAANVAPKACVYLNNKTLTLTQYLYGGFSGVFNVIGDGTLTTTYSTLITPYTCTLNLYGGNYIAKTGGTALKMGGSGSKVNLYGNATLQGITALSQGKVTLYGNAAVTDLRLSGTGLMTVAANWNGEAVLTVADGLLAEDGKTILAANAVASGDFPGSIKSVAGTPYKNVNGALVYSPKTPVWGEFDPAACDGYAYCEACGEEAGPVEWIEVCTDNDALGFKDNSDGTLSPFHYYLSKDISHDGTGGQWIGLYKVGGCINLNGHTLTTASRVFAGGAGAYMNIIAGDGGAINYTGEVHQGGIVTSVPTNIYGGTYTSTQATDAEVYKPIIQVTGGTTNLYDVTANGRVELASGTTTFYGTTTASNVTIDTYLTDANGNTAVANGKLVIDAGWTGTATLASLKDGVYADGVIAARYGAATGDFTGTLTLADSTKLVNSGGALQMDVTFNPSAATNYCPQCKAFVTWTALSGDTNIGLVQTDADGAKHLHYFLSDDVNYTGNDVFVNVRRENNDYAAVSSVCLELNGKNLTTKGRLQSGWGCDLTIFGEGSTITYTGTEALFYAETSNVRLYGGTYNAGSPVINTLDTANAKIYMYDGATFNGTFKAPTGNLYLYGASSVNKVVVSGTGKVNLDAGWTGTLVLDASAVLDGTKVPAANVAVGGDALKGTVTDASGAAYIYADGQLSIDTSFDAETATGYCRACGTTVQWEALGETWTTLYPTGTHYHYYLADDITNTATNLFYTATNVGKPEGYEGGAVGNTFCLYLNGKTLTMQGGKIYAGNSGFVNVMGDGTVQATAAYIFYPYTGTVNLYGGTYIASANGMVGFTGGGGTVYNIYEDADLQGAMTVSQGKLNIFDEAKLSAVEITGGLTTFKSGWTGTAAVNAAADLLTNNTIDVTKAYVEDGATGTLSSVTGVAATVENHAIKLSTPDPDEFNPEAYNGYAFCPDCGQLVQWTDFNAYVAKNGFHDVNNTLSDTSGVITLHFYLSADLEYTTNVMSTYENVIFNLNGYDITAVAADGAETITAGHAFSSTQGLVLLNTAEEMSTVTGWQTASGSATVIHMGGAGASSWARLYDNVTLTTHEACTTDAPVVHVATNGGKFTMKGGVIDASKKVNNLYPTAVFVQGQPDNEKYGPSVGEFYLEGGEIIGGASGENSGTVRIGSRSGEATYIDGAKLVMTGGTISGGEAKNGGNIFANNNAAEVTINGGVVTGGVAQNGGNIYVNGADLNIGADAVISDGFLPYDPEGVAGGGGGNIYFANGTFTTSGTITGGTVEKFKGAGGNIFLDGSASNGNITFIMTGGLIANGKLPVGDEDIYGGADFGGQSYGANIRGYRIKDVQLLGGTIQGGMGGNDTKADGRDVFLSSNDATVSTLTIGSVTINGAVHHGVGNLILKDAPQITSADGVYALNVGNSSETLMDISGLTEGASVQVSGVVANAPFTVACENVEDVKGCITIIDCGATLTTIDNQLILVGVAIVNGDEITWYADNAAAVAAYTYADGKYIQLGIDTALALTGGEYLIDLAGNGELAEVAITGTGTVHLFDSANADFDGYRTATVADTITLVRDNNVIVDDEAIRYITVTIEGKTSAHALAMAITDVNLRTDAAGLYYGAQYKCDDVLAGLVSAYGVALSLNDVPGAVQTSDDQRTVLTDFASGTYATSSSVTGIFKETRTAEKNAAYGKMKIYANAYIQLDVDGDGVVDTLVADTENVGKKTGNAWSLHDVLVTIDQNWADYAKDQEAVKAFYDTWFELGMSAYADDFTNIDVKVDVEGGEGEGVTPEDTDVDVEV